MANLYFGTLRETKFEKKDLSQMLSRAKASKETTYCVLTEFRETDMFLRPLKRLSEVENPTLGGLTYPGGYTLGN